MTSKRKVKMNRATAVTNDVVVKPIEVRVGTKDVDSICELAGKLVPPSIVLFYPEFDKFMIVPKSMVPKTKLLS